MKINIINKNRKYLIFMFFCVILICFIICKITFLNKAKFNKNIFDISNVYNHINEISSQKYSGRLSGTDGNEKAVQYIINHFKEVGVEPGGDENSYIQEFQTLAPIPKDESVFEILDKSGQAVKKFEIGIDYGDDLNGYGGSGEISSKLLFVEKDIKEYEHEDINGKILVCVHGKLANKEMEYVLNNGAVGIINYSANWNYYIPQSLRNKKGITIPIKNVNSKTLEILYEFKDKEYTAYLKNDYKLSPHISKNVLGIIPGRKKDGGYVIISAKLDSLGSESSSRFYQGAVDSSSSIGIMLELARVLKSQNIQPQSTIVFALWNNECYGNSGSKYYCENPIYPLDKSKVILLHRLGASDELINLISDGKRGETFKEQFYQYSNDLGLDVRKEYAMIDEGYDTFVHMNVPTILIKDITYNDIFKNSLKRYEFDTINSINKEQINNISELLITYIQRQVYKDLTPDYLSKNSVKFMVIFFIGLIIITIIYFFNKINPNIKILKLTIHDIFYSSIYMIISKLYMYTSIILIALFGIAFIGYFPKDYGVENYAGQSFSNYIPFLTIKNSYKYIDSFFTNGFGYTDYGVEISSLVRTNAFKSLKLIIGTIVIAFILGTLKGIHDGFKNNRKRKTSNIGSIIALSLPDVLIVILFIQSIYLLNMANILNGIFKNQLFTSYIVPLICLSIIPTAYISRIVYTFVREEVLKDYIKSARAKGLSKFKIIKNHLLIGSVFKVLDSMSSILTIIISNLIIIEYLYYYPGVVYKVLSSYFQLFDHRSYVLIQAPSPIEFIAYIISIGLIFIILSSIFKLCAYIFNPLKREGK